MSSSATARSNPEFLVARGAVLDETGVQANHYGDPEQELVAFTDSAALVDRTGSTCLVHEGEDALDLLHRLSTNDLISLQTGEARFTILTSERGRIIDVLHVAVIEQGKLLLLSESPESKPAVDWIEKFTIIEDAEVRDVSDKFARVAVVGTEAVQTVERAFGVALTDGHVVSVNGEGGDTILVASKWAGTDRVDVVTPHGNFEQAWDSLVSVGAVPAGKIAFEAARVAHGIPLAGHELTQDSNPLEVNLKDIVSFTKGCYVGQEVVARLGTYDKLQRRLVAFESTSPIKAGTDLTSGSKRAGTITSVSTLTGNCKTVALGFARKEFWQNGTTLEFDGGTVAVKDLDEGAGFS